MQKLKGFSIQELAPLAIAFVVLAIAIGMGATMLADLQENQCDFSWGTYAGSDAVYPTTGSNTGCCQTANASDSTDCDTWSVAYDMNITEDGLGSLDTFGDWMPTLALVVIAAVIIGVLVFYLGRSGSRR